MEVTDHAPISLESSTIILVVADSNFINLCKDPHGYVQLLKTRVSTLFDNNACIYTVSGKYGIANIDDTIPVIDVNDRNKTLFSQTLENSSMFFDQLMAISTVERDPYIESAKEVMTTANKTFTQYGYPRKS